MSKINVNTWEPESSTALTMGATGDTVTVPSGASLVVSGTFTSVGIDDNATATSITIDSDGAVTKPLTPAFLAYNSVADASVTGNGVTYTVLCDTEVFDQNSDYDGASGTFTAPVSGRYFLQCQVSTYDQSTTNTDGSLTLVTSNKAYLADYSPGNMEGSAATGVCSMNLSGILDMDAADTAFFKVKIYFGTQNIGIAANSTFFSGVLVA